MYICMYIYIYTYTYIHIHESHCIMIQSCSTYTQCLDTYICACTANCR